MKKRRQAKILEIISNNDVETQEELQAYLNAEGYEVTQATISRDVKEMRLIKAHSASGRYVYSVNKKPSANMEHKVGEIFAEAIVSVNYAMNTVCIKCFSGMAGAACAAIDAVNWDGVVGTIAGDDTIFVLCKDENNAQIFSYNLEKTLNA